MTMHAKHGRAPNAYAGMSLACACAAVLAVACAADEEPQGGGGNPVSAAGTTAGTSGTAAVGASGTGDPVGGASGSVMAGNAAMSGTGTVAGMTASDAGGNIGGMAASGVAGTSSGMAAGGAGGASAGMAASGTGGGSAGADGSSASPSAGCNAATAPESGRFGVEVDGMMREYIIAVPDDYDASNPYPVVFAWHPLGGSAQQVAGMGFGGYYGLQAEADGAAIFVAPEGLVFQGFGGNSLGWANTNGRDVAFFDAMLERMGAEMCIDESRIFSTGFSFGGMMSYALGCARGGVVRAIAPMAGNLMGSGCAQGTEPVAVMGFHGDDDTVVTPDGGRAGRDVFVGRNGCTEQATPVEGYCEDLGQNNQPCSCVSYDGCTDGHPVIWCEFNGPHTPAPNSAAPIWQFFSQF